MERLARPSAATALAALATAIALASAWHSGERMWRHLDEQRRVYGNYTDAQRRHAAIDTMGLPSEGLWTFALWAAVESASIGTIAVNSFGNTRG